LQDWRRSPTGVCEDVVVPLVVSALLVFLVRRVRPVSVVFAAYEVWRRLPPEHRRRLLGAAQRNAPRVARSLVRVSRRKSGLG
jgi:hypothetical protein